MNGAFIAEDSRGQMGSTRILLASYHFPPSAAVGGLRIARFARLLPEYGWEPYVITVRDEDRDHEEGTDRTRLAGLEAIRIERTRAPSGIIALYGRVKSRLRKPSSVLAGEESHRGAVTSKHEYRETLVHRLKRYIFSLFVRLPDEQKIWAVLAIPTAIRMIRKHRIECVLTSGPPFSVHLVGLAASLFTGAHWVADFRDPWIEMLPERAPATRSWLSDRLEEWMELTVLSRADQVLTTTERIRGSMIERHPSLPAHKFSYLPNGIDVERLLGTRRVEKFEPLTITYAGTLYFDRTPEPVFHALSELVREGLVRQEEFCIKLVGNCRQISGVDTLDIARKYGIASAVEVIDRVPHGEAIRIMQRSHLLLVLAPPNHDLVLPAKIFDYLGSGSKILALAGDGATADLISETGAGACFAPSDVSALKGYFQRLLEGGRYKDLQNEPGSFARYDARVLTGQLVAELSDNMGHESRVPQGT
jgi:glycosyltransferase involved in cell wall biosynthesis